MDKLSFLGKSVSMSIKKKIKQLSTQIGPTNLSLKENQHFALTTSNER